jgi:hypothetical protein
VHFVVVVDVLLERVELALEQVAGLRRRLADPRVALRLLGREKRERLLYLGF